jgi:hypothetical protein
MPSQSEAESSYASGSHDIEMENVDMEFDPQVYQGPVKKWTGDSYQKARMVCAYEYEENSLTPQFWTKVQHNAFNGHLLKKSVFADKSIDWDYLDQFASTHPLRTKFQHIGLLQFTQFTCDWNETIIRQFYATVEIDWDEESITWMTATRKCTTTFVEFATTCHINFETSESGECVWNSAPISIDSHRDFYKLNQYNGQGSVNGLRVMPAVINKIMRFTLYPKSGNSDTICDHHWNLVDLIMRRQRISIVRFMLNYIEIISSSVLYNLYYTPFIMSLILSKTNFPVRACTIKHNSYQSFGATKQVLRASDEGDEPPHEQDDAPPQPQAQGPPPMATLDSLMPHIMNVVQQGIQVGIASFHSSYNEQYHQPVMQQFDTLNANIGVVWSDVESLTNQFGHLSRSVQNMQQQFTGFSDHFFNVFPHGPPPPGYMPYPYYHPMPPPPPPEDDE